MIEIRPLQLRDLTAIEEIERSAYPTPWSRSMFAGELSKPSSICLGAFEEQTLRGYLITSRYVDAWHVMNVAVAPDRQRMGIASSLLGRLFELTASTTTAAATRWRSGSRTRRRSRSTSGSASNPAASAAATTRTTARTR